MWSNMWSGGFFDHIGLRGNCLYLRRIKGLRARYFPACFGSDPLPNVAPYQLSHTRLFTFLPLYHGGGENQRFFCLWSFMWSKPLLCRFQQPGEIPQTQASQGFAAFRLTLSRIPPRRSQTTHFLFFVHTAQEPTANFCRIDGSNCVARATIRC